MSKTKAETEDTKTKNNKYNLYLTLDSQSPSWRIRALSLFAQQSAALFVFAPFRSSPPCRSLLFWLVSVGSGETFPACRFAEQRRRVDCCLTFQVSPDHHPQLVFLAAAFLSSFSAKNNYIIRIRTQQPHRRLVRRFAVCAAVAWRLSGLDIVCRP